MKQILTSLLLAIGMMNSSYAQNGWVQKQNGPAKHRAGSFVIGNYAYYGAGNDSYGSAETNTWFRYDPQNDSWTQIASMPQGMQALETFVINGKGYAGMGWFSGYSTSLFYEYDPVSNNWTQKASYPTNTVHDAGSFSLNNEGYVYGGAVPYSNAVQAVTYKYNTLSNSWSSVAPLPTGLRCGVGYVLNNMAYVINGESPSGTPYGAGFRYDPITDNWTSISVPGGFTYRYNIATKDSEAFVIKTLYGTFGNNMNEFWKFNGNSQNWTQLPDRPFSDAATAFVNISGRLFAFLPNGQVWEYTGDILTPEFAQSCDTATFPTNYSSGYGRCIRTNDGNIVTVGTINMQFNWVDGDIVLNKYDSDLNLIWSKVFYAGGAHDYALGVIETSDGGYLINGAFGKSNAPGVFSAGYIIKTDSLGNQQWVQTLTGQSYGDNYGSIAVENSNGEFICYGHVQHHMGCSSYATRITKLAPNGNIVWSNCLQINPDWTGGIDKLPGVNNYVSVFNDQNNGTIFLRKWNDNGQQTAIAPYKFNNSFNTIGQISTAKNAGFFIFGNYDTAGGKKNAFIAYFDNNMNLQWEKSYSKSTTSLFQRATQDNAGNIYCTGGIYTSNQVFDLLAVKFDPNGNLIGSGRFGNMNDADLGNGIAVLDNGDIVCSGSTGSTALLVKFCGLGCGNGQSQAYYSDVDGDGFGDSLLGYFCQPPANSSITNGDCNDTDPAINPSGIEICNGIDDDCDGTTDEGLAPVVDPITGPAVQCINLGFGAATFSVPAVNGANSYNWILPQGVSVMSGQGTNILTLYWNLPQAHTGITGPLKLVVTGNCGQTEVSVDLHLQISIPVRPSSISGPSKLCPGEQATFSVLTVARCRLYNWTLPTGMNILSGAGTNIITVNTDSSYIGGAISLTASNACGTGPVRQKNLLLNNPVIPGFITGPSGGLCEQTGIAYVLSSASGATSYHWTAPQGASITNGQGTNSISVDFGPTFNNGTLSVIAQNNCGSSAARTLSLQASPSKPGLITGLQQICPGQVQVPYSIQTVSNTTSYNWSLLASLGNIVNGQGTKTITINYNYVNTTGQQLSVTASNNCGTSTASVLNGINIQPSNCNRNEISHLDESIYLYPNPSTNILFLGGNLKDPVFYKIFNITGQLVSSGNTSEVINISGLSAGMYLCEIRDEQGHILLLDRMEIQR